MKKTKKKNPLTLGETFRRIIKATEEMLGNQQFIVVIVYAQIHPTLATITWDIDSEKYGWTEGIHQDPRNALEEMRNRIPKKDRPPFNLKASDFLVGA